MFSLNSSRGRDRWGRNCLVIQGKRLLYNAAADSCTAPRWCSAGNVKALFTHALLPHATVPTSATVLRLLQVCERVAEVQVGCITHPPTLTSNPADTAAACKGRNME